MRSRVGSHEPPSSTESSPALRRVFRGHLLLRMAGGPAVVWSFVLTLGFPDRVPDDDGGRRLGPPRHFHHSLDLAACQRGLAVPFFREPRSHAGGSKDSGRFGPNAGRLP